jgi:microcystin-dependent protein
MSTPFLGEVKLISFNFPPKGWAFCNGQLLPINQNQALFSILGTTYGGNGQTNFALPNLMGRTALHMGSGFTLGQTGGELAHTLNISEMAGHNHGCRGSTAAVDSGTPVNNAWGPQAANPFSKTPNTGMGPTAVSTVGGGQPHNNLQPVLVVNFIIALQGIFPTRN